MTKNEALQIVIDLASRWLDNAEEGLTTRVSDEMLTNDKLWATVLAEQKSDYEREDANTIRTALIAIRILQELNRR